MNKLIPLNPSVHQSIKVTGAEFHPSVRDHHLLPLYAGEFVLAAAHYPVVFAKDGETGRIHCAALVGLRPQENLFYCGDDWGRAYAPISARPAPLVAVPKSADDDELIICIQQGSEYLSEETGEALFTANGEQTEFLKEQIKLAAEVRLQAEQTELIVAKLLELKLIEASPISVNPAGQQGYELTGLYALSEARLAELENDVFLELRDKDYLPAVYAAIASQYRLNDLLVLQQQTANGE